MRRWIFAAIFLACSALPAMGFIVTLERDTITTSAGKVVITFLGHATLMMQVDGKIIHIDPVSQYADYAALPKADIILVTHDHGDHCDVNAIETLRKPETIVLCTALCGPKVKEARTISNGETAVIDGIKIDAVPAYNLEHKTGEGVPFHAKGEGNGYVITIGRSHFYIAGDTENTPEMKSLKKIDVAFLPMNLPYTMTPAMVVDAVKSFRPRILYPYHYGKTNVRELLNLMKAEKGIEVRVRRME
jgi:L-ascorbate metabolism protein UlaG (beta-lactamase superfamily)